MNRQFRFSHRICSIAALCLICLVGLSIFALWNLRVAIKSNRQIELQHLVEIAVGIAKEEHSKILDTGVSEESARRTAAQRIGQLRYGTDDYFWINDLGPKMVMHPMKPELNGKDLTGFKDPEGKALFVEFANTVRKYGAGVVDYQWPRAGSEKPQPKLSFVSGFTPWGWVIGTGVYIDDLDQTIYGEAQRLMTVTAIALLFLCGLTFLIVRPMTGALGKMSAALDRLGEGLFDAEIPGLTRRDELGNMGEVD